MDCSENERDGQGDTRQAAGTRRRREFEDSEDAEKLQLEGKRLDKCGGVEKRSQEKGERTKAEKICGEQTEQAKIEAFNTSWSSKLEVLAG